MPNNRQKRLGSTSYKLTLPRLEVYVMQNGDNASRRWLSSPRDVASGKNILSLCLSVFFFSTREEKRTVSMANVEPVFPEDLWVSTVSIVVDDQQEIERPPLLFCPRSRSCSTGFPKDLHAKLSRVWSRYRLSMHRFIDRLDYHCILVYDLIVVKEKRYCFDVYLLGFRSTIPS